MRRRELVKNGILAAGAIPASSVLRFVSDIKVGVMTNLFKLSGYASAGQTGLIEYTDHKLAQSDLAAGKINVLISSTHFLLSEQNQLSLFGSFPSFYLNNQSKDEWIKQNYSLVSDYYTTKGLHSEYVGSFSALKVRMSNISMEQLSNWKTASPKITVAADGSRATWFDSLGFDVKKGGLKDHLDNQIINMYGNRLQLTDSFSPALFLKSILFNKSIENNEKWELKALLEKAKEYAGNLSLEAHMNFQLIRDQSTKGSLPVEVVYRKNDKSAALAVARIKNQLARLIRYDEAYQQQAMEILIKDFKLSYNDELPLPLAKALRNCTDSYMKLLVESKACSSQLVASYNLKTLERA